MLSIHRLLAPTHVAHAHCDVPCGIYDPDQARIEAESIYKILEKYHAADDEHFKQRCVLVKEERAELAKRHLDVLWTDYFKPEHVQKFPEIGDLSWKAAKQCSKVKQSLDLTEVQTLLDLIDRIAEVWRKAGGAEQTRLQRAKKAA